jgi:hypothetical protein
LTTRQCAVTSGTLAAGAGETPAPVDRRVGRQTLQPVFLADQAQRRGSFANWRQPAMGDQLRHAIRDSAAEVQFFRS